MALSQQLAKHSREVFFGGNWTTVNLKDLAKDLHWQDATRSINGLNSIARLVFHIHYYVAAVLKVFDGGPLSSSDKYSFDLIPITTQEEWENLWQQALDDAERFAKHVEQIPEEKFYESFVDEKYGNYYRNIAGITEHAHYHLGQIAILKKIILQEKKGIE